MPPKLSPPGRTQESRRPIEFQSWPAGCTAATGVDVPGKNRFLADFATGIHRIEAKSGGSGSGGGDASPYASLHKDFRISRAALQKQCRFRLPGKLRQCPLQKRAVSCVHLDKRDERLECVREGKRVSAPGNSEKPSANAGAPSFAFRRRFATKEITSGFCTELEFPPRWCPGDFPGGTRPRKRIRTGSSRPLP